MWYNFFPFHKMLRVSPRHGDRDFGSGVERRGFGGPGGSHGCEAVKAGAILETNIDREMDMTKISFAPIDPASGNFFLAVGMLILFPVASGGIWYLYKSTYPSVEDISKAETDLFKIRIENEGEHDNVDVTLQFDRERFSTIRFIFDIQESSWSASLQTVVSLFVIGLICVLIIVGAIESQAGLPIIAAVGGAAAGKSGVFGRNQPQLTSSSTQPFSPPNAQRRKEKPEVYD